MKDLRVIFNGADNTLIDFSQSVEGKRYQEQRVLLNLVTDQGSDLLYPDRGTTLLRDAINGLAYDINEAKHSANFAAIDTLFFIRAIDAKERYSEYAPEEDAEDEADAETDPDSIVNVDLDPIAFSASDSTISMSVTIQFADSTATKSVAAAEVSL